MATFRKVGNGWRAEVARQGIRRSKVHPTKRAAQEWAAREEYLILNGEKAASAQPLAEVFDRYAREVSTTKRGARWEQIRLEKLQGDKIGKVKIGDLTPEDLAEWRDRRLREVAPGSVKREMNLIGSVLSQAADEWGLLKENPMRKVRKPKEPAARNRLPTDGEIERLRHVAGTDLNMIQARAFHAFLFAGETAMRAGEIVGLTWEHVHLDRKVAHLPQTKNGHARDVPLSSAAVALIEALPRNDPVFGLDSRQIDAHWRKIRTKAAVEDLTFHDSRAWGLTRLSRKVDALRLAKISGHRDLKMLLNVYYRETADDIAKLLD